MQGRKIIVVGAGIAGLVAARHLSRDGHQVQVLEAADRPGGRVGEREVRGIRFNTGARLVYAFSPAFNRLLADVGLTDALIPVHRLSADCVARDGQWTVELMPGVKSLLTPGLSLGERLRFLAFGARSLRARKTTDPDDAASAPAADTQTLAAFVSKALGPRVLDRMIEPIFRGTRSWNAEDSSAAFFATTAPHLIGKDTVHVFAGGMNRLPVALAQGLAIDYGCVVQGVEVPSVGPCRVHVQRHGTAVIHDADLVVCATEGALAAALFADLPAVDRHFLEGVRYNPLGIVHYRLNRPAAAEMKFFTRAAAGPISTWQVLPDDPATGRAAQLYAQLSPEAATQAIARQMTDRLDVLVADRVEQLYPGLGRDCADLHNQWITRMLPLFYPGYAQAMAAFRDRQSGTSRRVYFCGDYLAQALITGAAASGARAARDVGLHWGPQ